MSTTRLPTLIRQLPAMKRQTTSFGSARRTFTTSFRRAEALTAAAAMPAPVRRPVGAFRGGMLGFFAGTCFAGAAVYYYILNEYKVSNELLTEDIYALQKSIETIHSYVQGLEEKVDTMERKKGK